LLWLSLSKKKSRSPCICVVGRSFFGISPKTKTENERVDEEFTSSLAVEIISLKSFYYLVKLEKKLWNLVIFVPLVWDWRNYWYLSIFLYILLCIRNPDMHKTHCWLVDYKFFFNENTLSATIVLEADKLMVLLRSLDKYSWIGLPCFAVRWRHQCFPHRGSNFCPWA